ncbi:MAG: GNAT family N-acetyltransferase [Akkermansiaceae bacterium]
MIECTGLNGSEAKDVLEHLAELRCRVFLEYPYLYDGDLAYERDYLSHYTHSDNAFLVIAKMDDQIIGVSSCIPLVEADPAFQEPFRAAGYDLEKIGYFGESVLLPEFRGQGVGHRFFDLREQWALKHHFTITTFCSVIRPVDHPARPEDYRPHDAFWNKRGYIRHDDLIANLDWPEVSEANNSPNHDIATDTSHKLVFWLKSTS